MTIARLLKGARPHILSLGIPDAFRVQALNVKPKVMHYSPPRTAGRRISWKQRQAAHAAADAKRLKAPLTPLSALLGLYKPVADAAETSKHDDVEKLSKAEEASWKRDVFNGLIS